MAVRGVPLVLGGKDWVLRCTLGAMAAVEDHGTTWTDALQQLQGAQPSMRAAQLIIWAMLQDADPGPSLREVGSWVDPENFPIVLTAVGDALRAAFPADKGGGQRPPMGRGTGTRSSVSPTVPLPSSPVPSGV
jgi:hypothetical protein